MLSARNYLVAIIAIFAGSLPLHAQKIHSFSIDQAMEYAGKNAVQVKNSLLDVLIQKQTNRDVTSIALPQISLSGNVLDYLDIPTTLVPGEFAGQPAGTFLPVKFGTKWTMGTGVSFNQLIFDGQVFIALKARNGTMNLSQRIAELAEENIRWNVYKIYYQLVAGKVQIKLLDDNIERLQKLQHDVTIMYENGFTEKLDIDKIGVQLTNLQTEKLKANNLIQNGYSGLKVLMGMPIQDSLQLADSINSTTILDGVLEAGQFNYSSRREFQIGEITNKLNGLNLRRYKLSQLPTFSIVGNYNKNAQRNSFDFFNKGNWFTSSYIGLSVQVPIFHGLQARARIRKAELELQKSINNQDQLKIQIDNEILAAKNNFTAAISTLDFQKKNMELAEKVYEQTKKKYEIGTGSTSEINDAHLELKNAQTNYLTALYDAIVAKADFLKANGKF